MRTAYLGRIELVVGLIGCRCYSGEVKIIDHLEENALAPPFESRIA